MSFCWKQRTEFKEKTSSGASCCYSNWINSKNFGRRAWCLNLQSFCVPTRQHGLKGRLINQVILLWLLWKNCSNFSRLLESQTPETDNNLRRIRSRLFKRWIALPTRQIIQWISVRQSNIIALSSGLCYPPFEQLGLAYKEKTPILSQLVLSKVNIVNITDNSIRHFRLRRQ